MYIPGKYRQIIKDPSIKRELYPLDYYSTGELALDSQKVDKQFLLLTRPAFVIWCEGDKN